MSVRPFGVMCLFYAIDTTEAQTGTAGGRSAEEHDLENPLYGGTEQGTKIELEEKQDLSENPYTELDHSPKQKPSEQSSFPYNTLEHSEDTPQKVDLAEQGAYDNTIDEPVQTQPPDEASAANGTVEANGTTHESSDMLSAVLEEGPKPSPSALAGGIYDIPPQESGESNWYRVNQLIVKLSTQVYFCACVKKRWCML